MAKTERRRAARERAFQVLYGLYFESADSELELARAFSRSPDQDIPVDSIQGKGLRRPEGFAWDLTFGVWKQQQELDEIIVRFSQNWRIERIAKTELAILRLALYEMLHRPDIPVKVAINEAVELAKQFGDENTRSFVNGILDAAAKAIENGEIGVH